MFIYVFLCSPSVGYVKYIIYEYREWLVCYIHPHLQANLTCHRVNSVLKKCKQNDVITMYKTHGSPVIKRRRQFTLHTSTSSMVNDSKLLRISENDVVTVHPPQNDVVNSPVIPQNHQWKKPQNCFVFLKTTSSQSTLKNDVFNSPVIPQHHQWKTPQNCFLFLCVLLSLRRPVYSNKLTTTYN